MLEWEDGETGGWDGRRTVGVIGASVRSCNESPLYSEGLFFTRVHTPAVVS
jgi:hypothetical protein